MGTNVDLLREGLNAYNQSLEKHVIRLREDFDSLMNGFYHLNQEYEGQAADEFKTAWKNTANWFQEYMDSTQSLSVFLEERITSLNNA